MSSEQHALVSTVDTLGPDFPSHCVVVLPTREEALKYAAEILVRYDNTEVTYDEEKQVWLFNGDEYSDPEDLLNDWQFGLDMTEYFHIMPVASASTFISPPKVQESPPVTFKEPFLSRVREAVEDAQGICWEGCHKIYVLMDQSSCDYFGGMGYQIRPTGNVDIAMQELYQWFDLSCGLRFIDKVSDQDRFEGLINQFSYDDEEQEQVG